MDNQPSIQDRKYPPLTPSVLDKNAAYTNIGDLIKELGVRVGQVRRTKAKTLKIYGYIIIIIGGIIGSSEFLRLLDLIFPGIFILLVIPYTLFAGFFARKISYAIKQNGVEIMFRGKKLEQVIAFIDHFNDTRRPVIYLRSFLDDGSGTAFSEDFAEIWGTSSDEMNTLLTDEGRLAKAISPVGPLLAIGKPGEKLPEIGANRIYSDPNGLKWEEDVKKMLRVCQAVVLRAGITDGLIWEFKTVFELVPPTQIMIYVCLPPERYEQFKANFQEWVGISLPDLYYNHAVIYFNQDYTTQVVPVKSPFLKKQIDGKEYYHYAYAMELLYERTNLPWKELNLSLSSPPKPSRISVWFAWIMIILFVLFILYLLSLPLQSL